MHRCGHVLLPMLVGLLFTAGCADTNVRKTAATAPPGIVDDDSYRDPRARREALAFLSSEADELSPAEQERVSTQLSQALAVEDDMLIREQIASALGAYRTEAAMTGLRTALSDEESIVRVAACGALGEHGEPAAVDLLTSALSGDNDVDVRLAAARALGMTESPQAVDSLVAALGDADPALRRRASESLKAVTGEDFKDDVDAWRAYAAKNRAGESAANIAQQPARLY